MHDQLSLKARAYNHLKDVLMSEYGLEADDQALLDTLTGATDLEDALIRAAREANRREAQAEAMASIVRDNQSRKSRHEHAAVRIREAISHAMGEAEIKRVEAADVTLTRRIADPKPEIVDEELVPMAFCKTVVTPSKTLINEAYKAAAGEFSIPGVVVGNGKPVISIRTK